MTEVYDFKLNVKMLCTPKHCASFNAFANEITVILCNSNLLNSFVKRGYNLDNVDIVNKAKVVLRRSKLVIETVTY